MSFVVTKLITTEESIDFYLLGSFSDMKKAADVAVEEYKDYNKKASFVNLEMVHEWLSTRGEYSFRQDKNNRIQLDISVTEENQTVQAEHQKIFSCTGSDREFLKLSESICPDGVKKAEL
ncbi:MAG: hypothetical protein K6C05_02185 [Anaerovibrio sp.]|uniref:hypothetical protein n=1 Tax=Anaerovibrio sp. TaxID=1872532 RepID=UPI0025E4797D|nr:hypothetical protein [Anaerovibrio sp.]MCR5175640.1 hypothetical protein [Anaerovibrio sp.]